MTTTNTNRPHIKGRFAGLNGRLVLNHKFKTQEMAYDASGHETKRGCFHSNPNAAGAKLAKKAIEGRIGCRNGKPVPAK